MREKIRTVHTCTVHEGTTKRSPLATFQTPCIYELFKLKGASWDSHPIVTRLVYLPTNVIINQSITQKTAGDKHLQIIAIASQLNNMLSP